MAADNISNLILFNKMLFLINILMVSVRQGSINNSPALVQIMDGKCSPGFN